MHLHRIYVRRSLFLCILGTLFVSGALAANPPTTKPAAKAPLSSDRVGISDYCTVFLSSPLQVALNLDAGQRAALDKQKDKFELQLNRAAGADVHGAPNAATILLGRTRRILELDGQQVRDLLTDAQDQQLQGLFNDGTLKKIEIRTVASQKNAMRRGAHTYGLIQVVYTPYGETEAGKTSASDSPSQSTTPPPTKSPPASHAPEKTSTAAKTPESSAPPAESSPSTPLDKTPLAEPLGAQAKAAIAAKSYQLSDIRAGAFAKRPFTDVPADSGVLIGVRYTLGAFVGKPVISSLQPIYSTPHGQVLGQVHGLEANGVQELKAKTGYAVGAITVAGGGGLDSLKLTFMKIDGKRLDPNDSYSSDKIGGPGGGSPWVFGGDGTPIVGLTGKVSDDKKSMGLGAVFLSPTPTSISKRAPK